MARDLRKRVTLAIIIPLFLGMLIITAVTCVPLYIEYSNYISNYDDHMISYEKHVMVELNKVIAARQSVGVLALAASLSQLSANLITNYYFGRIESMPGWKNDSILIEYVNETSIYSDTQGLFQSDLSTAKNDINYHNSSVFYYFMQPIIKIGERFQNIITGAHITYSNNFFVFFPSNSKFYSNFSTNFKNNPPSKSYYWNLTESYKTLTYIPENYNMVCKPLLIRNTYIGTLPCLIYSLDSPELDGSGYSDNEQLTVVDENYVIYYPLNKRNKDFCIENFDFECSVCNENTTSTSDANDFKIFDKDYFTEARIMQESLPDSKKCKVADAISNHGDYINSLVEYKFGGETKVITVSPINISLPILQSSSRTFSAVLGTKKSEMSRKFDKLSDVLTRTIMIQIIVFSIVLVVIICIVCLISYKITSSVIAPIDNLYKILRRLHTDLGVNVKNHIKKGPPEVTDLYEVFDRLRLILRFEDAKLFKDPTYAMMNYAQALKLFHNFNNKRAMEKCFQEIGNIHMSEHRYLEAAMNFHCSLLISQEIQLDDTEIAIKQINTATAMLKARAKPQRAKLLFYEALNYYSSQPITKKLPVYLDLIECLLINKDTVTSEMTKAREYLSVLNDQCDDYIINQRFRYLEGFEAFNRNQFRRAAELCTEALEAFPDSDRATRGKCLKLLKKIFKKFSIPTEQVEILTQSLKNCPKDIVVVIEKKIGEAINDEIFHEVIENIFCKDDKISFIQFDENCQVVYNMTTTPRRRGSTLTSFIEFQNKCVLYDAIYMALVQISSVNLIIPQSFLSKQAEKKEWVFVITYGEDFGSSVNEEKLWNKLYGSEANLVVVALNPTVEVIKKLEALVRVTPFGVFLSIFDFCDIREILLKAAAFISGSDFLTV